MLISFKNHMFNPDHITYCELRPAGSDEDVEDTELYMLFTGEGELSLTGEDALRLWAYLAAFQVFDNACARTELPTLLTA